MHSDQWPYVELYRRLLDYEGEDAFTDVLLPWLAENEKEIAWLAQFAARTGEPVPAADHTEVWRLFALSQVLEVLALPFQPPGKDGDSIGPQITGEQFERFATALGLTVVRPTAWSPFHHEIVELLPAGDAGAGNAPRYRWACLMLGPMLMFRGGVDIAATGNMLVAGIADRSILYWATWRRSRRTQDLSDGWGSNSRWRTAFRRDYLIDGTRHLNVDGDNDLATARPQPDDNLTRAERIELLVHRGFVACAKDDNNAFPYDDRISLPPS